MLFESSNQILITLIFIWLGMLIASFSEFLLFKTKNKIINYMIDFIFWCISIFLFFVFITYFNYGNVRFYCILSFFVGFLIVKFFWHNLIAKIKNIVYNIINKLWHLLKEQYIYKKSIKSKAKNEKCQLEKKLIKLKNTPQKKRRITDDRKKVKNLS